MSEEENENKNTNSDPEVDEDKPIKRKSKNNSQLKRIAVSDDEEEEEEEYEQEEAKPSEDMEEEDAEEEEEKANEDSNGSENEIKKPSKESLSPTKSSKSKKESIKKEKKEKVEEEEEEDDDEDEIIKVKTTPKKRKRQSNKEKSEKTPKRQAKDSSSGSGSGKILLNLKDHYENQIGYYRIDKESSLKPQLVKRLLIRWGYVMNWPDQIEAERCPENYIGIEGYPGIFIGVKDEALGDIMDRRDKTNIPSYDNLMKKNSKELHDLLIMAIQKEMEELKKEEGEEAVTMNILRREMKEFKDNFDIELAEKEYQLSLKKKVVSKK